MAIGCAAAVLGGALAACALVRRVHPADQPWRWEESRSEYLRRSRVWLGGDVDAWVRHVRSLDLRKGPPGRDAFVPEALVRCEYVRPPAGAELGRTPKFLCRHRGANGDEVLKVKWGADNGEVFAEVVGTRLFWALGFPTDRMYPVRVECRGCPADPWQGGEYEAGSARRFEPAVVERPFPGETIEEFADQGWTWAELVQVDVAAGGASRAELDALSLLAAFVQHRDSKPGNQRLVCPPDEIGIDPDGRDDCGKPIGLVQDLGSTLGGPARLATHKMDLQAWREAPVWENPRRCVANLTSEITATGGLERPVIGDEGRRLLSALLDALDDRQLRALFQVARADRRGGVSEWVAAFGKRRDAVRQPVPSEPGFRCPAS